MLVLVLFLLMQHGFADLSPIERELKMDAIQEIEFNGYPAEEYKVETKDGYILQMQRIPYGKSGPRKASAQPVLLLHGMGGESAEFVDKLDESLAFKFVDRGYDLWLGNMRGNRYGLNHKTLKSTAAAFWNFTWDDVAAKDLPAMLNFVLDATKAEKLFFAGHSMGNGVGMMLLATEPEWNDKIKGFGGIFPITRLSYTTSVSLILINYVKSILNLLPDEFLWMPSANHDMPELPFVPKFISTIFKAVNFDPKSNDHVDPRKSIYDKHVLSGTSLKTNFQSYQFATTKRFSYFDYGRTRNMKIYHSETPPLYDLTKVTTPVALFTSISDPMATPLDVALLANDLPNLLSYYKSPYVMFPHLGLTHGYYQDRNAMYDAIIEAFDQIRNA